jgi:hypothetical protein
MGWLFGQTWPWVLLTALLGAVITFLLTIRKLEVTTVRARATSTGPDVVDAGTDADADVAAVDATGSAGVDAGAAVVAGKYPGSTEPTSDGSAPAGHDVKGNEQSMLYHTGASPYFARTKVDVWFDSEDSARAAGFTRWDHRDTAGPEAVPEGAFGLGSADPLQDGAAPEGFTIKANSGSMLFHTDQSPYYARIKAEVWFSSEQAARAAGFARWDEH